MNKESKHLIIVGFGPVAGYKYSRCIRSAIESGKISSYSIVDLESQRANVMARVHGLPAQPENIHFLPDANGLSAEQGIRHFDAICRQKMTRYGQSIKVVIATEAQAHEAYLDYCVTRGFDSLTTKPIILPMKNGFFHPKALHRKMGTLLDKASKHPANHSILCLGRYHDIYNDGVEQQIVEKMNDLNIPVTSVNLKTSSGVWNLEDEFQSRDDHPYKFGYGMLMHGGYHYIDLVARFLTMNRRIYPNMDMALDVASFSAYPKDQPIRIPSTLTGRLRDADRLTKMETDLRRNFGETDVVSTLRLYDRESDRTLTLGGLTLEQTTPGMRSWGPFPDVPYNINGRLHCTDLDVRLATVFAANGHVVKIPISGRQGPTDLRGRNFGRVTTRSNVDMTGDQEFHQERTITRPYGNSFSYAAESAVFNEWLEGHETRSSLQSHQASIALLQALAESLPRGGRKISIDFNYPAHGIDANALRGKNNSASFNDRGRAIFAAYAM